MGRLFWKIFLSFWFTLVLVVLVSNWGTALYLHSQDDQQKTTTREKLAKDKLEIIATAIEYGGIPAVNRTLKRGKRPPRAMLELTITDAAGNIIIHKERRKPRLRPNVNSIEISKKATSFNTDEFIIIAKVAKRRPPHPFFGFLLRPFERFPALAFLWVGVAMLISGIVCFWLAWYLTHPIRQLQIASRQLASGDLNTRVAKSMGKRRDEISDLGNDFDYMAERLQTLIHSQKQLLSDVSHELRSPLARLQVALGLTRKKVDTNVQTELDRIEREATRLDDLIHQVLTLSRLDTDNTYKKNDYVDLAQLLEAVVADANFEAKEKQRHIMLKIQQTWTIAANAELLHRALENIIRNAIHYTAKSTHVTINLQASPKHKSTIQLAVCDQGAGVPEDQLDSLFEPFVRISNSRNRDSGGYGLGLAIAQRAINLHNGEIIATNQPEGGLCITVLLPNR